MKFTSVLAVADQPNKNGDIYTKEALEKIALSDERMYLEHDRLMFIQDLEVVDIRPFGEYSVSVECKAVPDKPEL